MIEKHVYKTAAEWLAARTSYIGGSDASSIIGCSPWRNNVQLWEEKTGKKASADLSNNEFVKYGNAAEPLLRKLFAIDNPTMRVEYEPFNMWTNDELPFAHASLDGWLTDENGRFGILEIKTASISNSAHAAQWKDKIPDAYFCQVLHYFAVTGARFAVVVAQLKYPAAETPYKVTKYIHIERSEVEDDIALLIECEAMFAENIRNNIAPALLLPNI